MKPGIEIKQWRGLRVSLQARGPTLEIAVDIDNISYGAYLEWPVVRVRARVLQGRTGLWRKEFSKVRRKSSRAITFPQSEA